MCYFKSCQSLSDEIISSCIFLGFAADGSVILELVQLVSRMNFEINTMDTIVDLEVGI